MKIEKFEDLDCWKKARELANSIYDLTNEKSFPKDFRLRDQMWDTAGSVMTLQKVLTQVRMQNSSVF